MIIVLDSNEYILFLNNLLPDLNKILENSNFKVYLHELIIKEVMRNIGEDQKKDFYKLLFKNNFIIHEEELPFYLFENYKKFGLKKGDILIASFCEWITADYLITQNRHFLREVKVNNFKILNLKEFLEIFG